MSTDEKGNRIPSSALYLDKIFKKLFHKLLISLLKSFFHIRTWKVSLKMSQGIHQSFSFSPLPHVSQTVWAKRSFCVESLKAIIPQFRVIHMWIKFLRSLSYAWKELFGLKNPSWLGWKCEIIKNVIQWMVVQWGEK